MSHPPQRDPPANTPGAPDPLPQAGRSEGGDATSGAEGGGPRVGSSEPTDADRLKFPKPVAARPKKK